MRSPEVTRLYLQVGPDEDAVQPVAAAGEIGDAVADERAAVARLESVLVDPEHAGAGDLLVHEAARRVPGGDARPPADRDAAQAELVVDQRALPHLDRARRQHAEAQPGRRDRLQVAGVGEERERALGGDGEPLPALEHVLTIEPADGAPSLADLRVRATDATRALVDAEARALRFP